MTTVAACAAACPLVALLLSDAARSRGVSVAVARVTHGLPAVAVETTKEVKEMNDLIVPARATPPRERCGACSGVINPQTGECRCSD